MFQTPVWPVIRRSINEWNKIDRCSYLPFQKFSNNRLQKCQHFESRHFWPVLKIYSKVWWNTLQHFCINGNIHIAKRHITIRKRIIAKLHVTHEHTQFVYHFLSKIWMNNWQVGFGTDLANVCDHILNLVQNSRYGGIKLIIYSNLNVTIHFFWQTIGFFISWL